MKTLQFLPDIFKKFDRIRIINLVERVDRRQAMLKEVQKYKLDHHRSIAFFDAVKRSSPGPFRRAGSHGAFDSYLAVLEEASLNNQSVLILQDDCRFLNTVNDEIILEKTDIFYGGWEAVGNRPLADCDIIGAHCMGFSARIIPVLLDYLRSYKLSDFEVDPLAKQQPGYDPAIRPPIDGAIVWFRRAHPDVEVVFHRIAVQRSTPSSITPRGNIFERGVNKIRKIVNI